MVGEKYAGPDRGRAQRLCDVILPKAKVEKARLAIAIAVGLFSLIPLIPVLCPPIGAQDTTLHPQAHMRSHTLFHCPFSLHSLFTHVCVSCRLPVLALVFQERLAAGSRPLSLASLLAVYFQCIFFSIVVLVEHVLVLSE